MGRRLFKFAFVAWLLGEWYMRGGRETLFGESVDEPRVGLETLRGWVTIPAPSIHHFYPASAFDQMVGLPVVLDGERIGRLTDAQRDEHGWARVRFEAERSKLGYPVNVAMSQVESAVTSAVGALASRLP